MSFKKNYNIKNVCFVSFFLYGIPKGYLEGKKAGRSDSIFKTYHLILEPAFKTSKGSHYIFCGRCCLAPVDYRTSFDSYFFFG